MEFSTINSRSVPSGLAINQLYISWTREWWYSSEMQGDQYDDFSPDQIAELIEAGEHVLEYEDSKNGSQQITSGSYTTNK